MDDSTNTAGFPERREGLPPVAPPSGRFILQLFLVPGLIVAVAVLLWFGFRSIFGQAQTADAFLSRLDDPNPEIRWRGASDLAQTLGREESPLRTDAKFGLDLAERLQKATNELSEEETRLQSKIAELPEKKRRKAWRKLDSKRKLVIFLTSAVRNFEAPVGAPVLCEIALRESPDLEGNAELRRIAVVALGHLGSNLRKFDKLDPEKKEEILSTLKKEAEGSSPRSDWARTALYYIDTRPAGGRVLMDSVVPVLVATAEHPWAATAMIYALNRTPTVTLVDETLAKLARAEDRGLREYVAVALSFWDGPLVEPTLLMLAEDDGHGKLIEVTPEEDG